MGVAAARPDRTVVLFDGDGSLMMHVQELETIKRHRLNILIVVMNDGAYGSELHKLRAEGMPEDGSVFGYCDFAGVARGFGLEGKTFTNSMMFRSSWPSSLQAAVPRSGTFTSPLKSCPRPSVAPILILPRKRRAERRRGSTQSPASIAGASRREGWTSLNLRESRGCGSCARRGMQVNSMRCE
jgi:hypothetical protein